MTPKSGKGSSPNRRTFVGVRADTMRDRLKKIEAENRKRAMEGVGK